MSATRLAVDSLKAMGRYKLRSGFMMLGILVGVAALTLVVSVGQAAERKILATVGQIFGGPSLIIYSGGGPMRGPQGGARLSLDDMEALARELPSIEAWDPERVFGSPVRRGDAAGRARIVGQSERSERVRNRGVSRGEYFDAAAVAGSSRVALIGETVARELFGAEDPLGGEILVGSVAFRVVGILERFGSDAHGMDRDDEVVVPITTAMRRLQNVDTISAAKVLVREEGQIEDTAREMKRVLRERHGLAPDQPDDFTVITATQVQAMVGKVQRVLFLFLPLAAGIALVVGGVVAASLMLASVSARVAEIGLRRAVGARHEDIRLQFLLETAVTASVGGLAGILLGAGLAQWAAQRMDLGGILSWQAALLGLVVSAATGLLAGVLPARRAARLQPADALR